MAENQRRVRENDVEIEVDGPGMTVKMRFNGQCRVEVQETGNRSAMRLLVDCQAAKRRREDETGLPPAVRQGLLWEQSKREQGLAKIKCRLDHLEDRVNNSLQNGDEGTTEASPSDCGKDKEDREDGGSHGEGGFDHSRH